MRQVHYDLDKVERDIRKMFADQSDVTPSDNPSLQDMHKWQNNAVDVFVSFVRWQLEMEMAGVQDKMNAYIVGVVLADLAQNVWSSYDEQYRLDAAQVITQGFVAQTNQCLDRDRRGIPPDAQTPLSSVTSGHA